MTTKLCVFALAGILAAPLAGQAGGALLTGSLQARSSMVTADSEIELLLEVQVPADTKVDKTFLNGTLLHTTVDGKKGPVIGKKVSGTVDVAGGTTLHRSMRIPVANVLPAGNDPTGVTHVTFQWPGLPAANVAVKVVPDASKIDLAKLDYTKTKVVLVTSQGNLTLGLFGDLAPNHARNFVKLASRGFFDGTKFHRIMRDFMIQGGCPNTKEGATGTPGTGSSGETVNAEINATKHVRGILSAARGPNDPNSHSSQFFLCTGQAPWLDGGYTAFGKLEDGDDVLTRIANTPVAASSTGELSVPRVAVHLHRAIVLPVLAK